MAGRMRQSWCRYCRHIFSNVELFYIKNDTCDKCEMMLK